MNKRFPIFIGILFLIFSIWIQVTSNPIIQHSILRLENIAYDLQLRAKYLNAKIPNTSVAIVDIDDKSLKEVGRWPWSRSKMALLIDKIKAQGAVVIALDIMFPDIEENQVEIILQDLTQKKLMTPAIESRLQQIAPDFNADMRLQKSITNSDIVLGFLFLPKAQTQGLLPKPVTTLTSAMEKQLALYNLIGFTSNNEILQSAAKNAGFINVFPDGDGIVRRVPLVMRYGDNIYPSLALEAVRVYLLAQIKLITELYVDRLHLEGIKIGKHIIPTDGNGQLVIPFRGKSFSFPYFSAVDVLKDKSINNIFSGKIVFIGSTAAGIGDLRATAIESLFPGVEIQATIADSILSDNFPFKPDWSLGANIVFTILLGIVCIGIFPFLGPRILALVIIAVPLLLLLLNSWLWERYGYIFSFLIPILFGFLFGIFNLIYGYVYESRRREQLKEMFGQYVPKKHIEEMTKIKSSYGLTGEEREMSVLFADIRNFTALAESMSAAEVRNLLNTFLTPMTEIIFRHRGTIDKYVGDLIMAFWGAPLRNKLHAHHAIAAAVDMQKALTKLNKEFVQRGWPEIVMGVGINSGLMTVGDMGTKYRRNYTVLGDAVNLASRVENLTKYYGVNLIVTEHTQKQQPEFIFRELDKVRVTGKKIPISIYAVIGRAEKVSSKLIEELNLYAQALNYYFSQQWEKAKTLFEELNQKNPQRLYSIYLERIAQFKKTPPPADWDGVFTYENK